MILSETHTVPNLDTPIRLQEYGVGIFSTNPTKSGLKKAIKKKLVYVNGTIASTALFIKGGELIELFQEEEKKTKKQFIFPLEVLFEDDFLAIIYKPAGILVNGNSFATIQNALNQNLKPSTQKDAVKPRPVHRLDYPTSGLLLISKTNAATHALMKLFEEKTIQKTYYAITIGKMKKEGIITIPVDEKESTSNYTTVGTITSEKYDFLNLVALQPKTGRRHQLRKHMLALGTPILGDKQYYKENLISYGNGLYLHAAKLEFVHPFTKESIQITKELPKKFRKIFDIII
ncbi:RluA family pseudouridine synthase [Tenacibaculum sp. M341]|uniref:RluA family pseudouridine synthase n=1 Tax=Tenacibaculum sp. M341 TaxID=2530339 RepID=UPI00105117C5|nr:RluA family pseudouridine synthase [Tenacibaculum sp. M341]TCI91148.1 RluA family pseudouridine synthase [Tenacibaculum sp. M341]